MYVICIFMTAIELYQRAHERAARLNVSLWHSVLLKRRINVKPMSKSIILFI